MKFDTDKIPNPKYNVLDLSTPEKTASLGTPFARNANVADSEVLIKESIPANVAIPYNVESKT
ncbi:hypothetical protein [Streptococcus xiaochunlingii]|uniref:hypothetical protein n=1 Tax=Streptococcus xiaochunlingii TaxID=2589788 RepID=UPI0025554D24|nr:hypothetical protein [Streptococcus xiaochunlingii]MDK8386307.1 hypothetical protein [Streptococcus xiaochunlingii]